MRLLIAVAAFAALSTAAYADPTLDIPLDLSGTRPAVAISIGGAPAELWIFDTGAGGTVINIDRARALNLPEEQPVRLGSPAGGTPQEGFMTTLNGASINGVALPALRVVAAPSLMPDRGGVLSPNAFRGRLVTFDFAHSIAHVSDKTPANIPSGEATPYSGGGGHHALPSIPVTVNGQALEAHLDSGSPGGLTLPYSMAASLPLAAPPVQTGVARFVDGTHPRYTATLNGHAQVGPLSLDNPQIEFIDGLPMVNIGMRLLSQMKVTLDPEQQRSWAVAAN